MAKKNLRKSKRHAKEQKEFEEEVLQIDRVTRVVKGGRRLRFRCTVAIGDKKGRVGVGVGKSTEVVSGIQKAVARAKANLIKVNIAEGDTIPHSVLVKHKAARMLIMPAAPGTGVIAGGALRKILHLAGVKNVLSKNMGTRNTLVTAQASIKALKMLRTPKNPKKKENDTKAVVAPPEKKKDTDLKKHSPKKEKTVDTSPKNNQAPEKREEKNNKEAA